MEALLKEMMKNHCDREGCSNEGTKRCSGCQQVYYCGEACQKRAWSAHKKGCKINAMLNKFNDEYAARPVERPPKNKCTGCGVRFDGDDYRVDSGPCPDCGYVTCESCSCHNSRGSCWCEKSNFGYLYCDREPQSYHISSRTGRSYKGDYHPDKRTSDLSYETMPSAFEGTPRKCNNCGKEKFCLTQEWIKTHRY